MKKALLIAIAWFGFVPAACAGDIFLVFTNRASMNPTDIVDWTQLGLTGEEFTSPQSILTFNGTNGLAGNQDGSNFARLDEGNGWVGNFDFGESLIWTGNLADFDFGGEGPMVIGFEVPIGSFGFNIQADNLGPFTASVAAFDAGDNLLFSHDFNGFSDSGENGSALFVGLGDTTGVNISYFTISTAAGGGTLDNDFAIDNVSLSYDLATPEPGSAALVAGVLVGMAGLLRRRLRR